MIRKMFSEDSACGMLVGLAVGDALGMTQSWVPRDAVEPVTDMVGGGSQALEPGQWGEATTMAMCLAQMLRSANGWDVEDAMKRFLNWRNHGYLSSTRVCFGMDDATSAALVRYERTGNPYAPREDAPEMGNGGIMRLAPVVLAYGSSSESAMAVAQLQSRITHSGPLCERAAANLAQVLVTGDRGLLPCPEAPPDVATREARETLHAAFWAIGQTFSFRDAVLAAVNLGGDAARVGAVTGQLAGRLYGYGAIPRVWRKLLQDHDKILQAAEDLYAMRPIDV